MLGMLAGNGTCSYSDTCGVPIMQDPASSYMAAGLKRKTIWSQTD